MAMQTVLFKERDEFSSNNPIGKLQPVVPQTSWWKVLGSQPLAMESHLGSVAAVADRVSGIKLAVLGTEQGMDKQNSATQFTLSTGDGKNSAVQKPQAAFTVQSTCFELGVAQPMICAHYPYLEQYYGVVSAYGSQVPGRVMLPINMATEDGPIYVNAKQYHGIIRRRQSRAKAVLQNKVTRSRKPYRHYSRHLHAMRRPRGTGGRFLNTKNLSKEKTRTEAKNKAEAEAKKQPRPTGSQHSEVVHPDNTTLNSSRLEANGSNVSGSEVTSMYTRGDFMMHHFLCSSPTGTVMSSKWVAAAAGDNGCCNLKV